jgi:hypothetical protein
LFIVITEDQNNDSNEKSFSYVQDPCANVKTGFGYSVSSKSINGGSINFIKGETINLKNNQNSDKNNVTSKQQKESITNCDIKKGNAIIFSCYILLFESYGNFFFS